MGIEIGFGVGTMILCGALAYGLAQYRRRDPRKEATTEEATRRIYAETER